MKLHIKAKLISIHSKMKVMDEADNVVYTVASKALSITDKTYIKNAEGQEVAYIHSKVLTVHNTHFVEMADGLKFSVSEELFHITKDVLRLEELGWELRGDFFGHNYEIYDENGALLAQCHKKWVTLHDIYCIDIMDDSKADLLVAVFVVLGHIITDKRIVKAEAAGAVGAVAGAQKSKQD